jgi:hypothetical protein
MTIKMNDSRIQTIQQIENFIKNNSFDFRIESKHEAYSWIQYTLTKFKYISSSKKTKSIIKSYIMLITSYSRSQTNRLIQKYQTSGSLEVKKYLRFQPNKQYSDQDIKLLT